MDDNLLSGRCSHCGYQILNDDTRLGNVNVTMDRSTELIGILKLAKYSMYDGDGTTARVLLGRAMLMDSENSDVWYMDAVLDRRNAKSDISRAGRYRSLGIFTEEDVPIYRDFDSTAYLMIFIFSFVMTFFAFVVCLPLAIIFEFMILLPIVLAVGAVVVIASYLLLRKHRGNIPEPVFADEMEKVERAVLGADGPSDGRSHP